jgi:hypothetical protein
MRRQLTLFAGALVFAICAALVIFGGSLLIAHILMSGAGAKH